MMRAPAYRMLLISGVVLTLGYIVPPYLVTILCANDRIYHALRAFSYIIGYTFFVTTYTRVVPKTAWSGWKFALSGTAVCLVYATWGVTSFFCMAGLADNTWALHQANTIAFLVGTETLLFVWRKSLGWEKFKTKLLLVIGSLLTVPELIIYTGFLWYYYPNHYVLHFPYSELIRAGGYLAALVFYGIWLHSHRPVAQWQPDKPAVFYYSSYRSKEVVGSLFGGAVYTIEEGKGVLYSYITCENKVVRFPNGEALVREFIAKKMLYATRVYEQLNDMRPTEGWGYVPYSWRFWETPKTCVQLRQYALLDRY